MSDLSEKNSDKCQASDLSEKTSIFSEHNGIVLWQQIYKLTVEQLKLPRHIIYSAPADFRTETTLNLGGSIFWSDFNVANTVWDQM